FAIPLSSVKRLERLASPSYAYVISFLTLHQIKIACHFTVSHQAAEEFCEILKQRLRENVKSMKDMKAFIASFYSEYLMSDRKGPVPPGGLGQIYHYPGDPRKLRDKSKMRLWADYFQSHGRNVTIARSPTFYKLVRIGLPNRLRGELWELLSGSSRLRSENAGSYQLLVKKYQGRDSVAVEEIEKDLNRSLPEYPGYLDSEGIDRLRRVLQVYAFENADVGYCQAMNIVVAGFLIYMSEEQAYWLLTKLCDDYIPGYYSKTMYGVLLDQKVFESLVEKTMPILWEHLVKQDVQLSVVSLPWFLSLFINSMPLVFAFRVVDVLFLEGPRVLFQIALAILRINGEELLDASDDGAFISIIKDYFNHLGDSAHPNSRHERIRAITKFQELLVVAFKEFSVITEDMIAKHRQKYNNSVLEGIESFAKRTQLRNLSNPGKFSSDDMGIIYDRFHQAIQTSRIGMGSERTSMDFQAFIYFMSNITDWATDSHDFLNRLYRNWCKNDSGYSEELTLQQVVIGLAHLKESDIMASMEYFFNLYDEDEDGRVDRDGILQMSEGFLFITRHWITLKIEEEVPSQRSSSSEKSGPDNHSKPARRNTVTKRTSYTTAFMGNPVAAGRISVDSNGQQSSALPVPGETYLGAVSDFIKRAFDYATPTETTPVESSETSKDSSSDKITANAALDPNHPLHITLPTFRMIVLADEMLEKLFSTDLAASVRL
ncbi:hypothetical protein CANCADRAFT_17757, partial [Tortispora caseinolytica NRRL Y-17796]